MKKFNLLVDSNNGRFGNQLYPMLCAITLYENNKNKFEDKIFFKNDGRLSDDILTSFDNKLFDIINFNIVDFDNKWLNIANNITHVYINNYTNQIPIINNIIIKGYCQNNKFIDEKIIQKYLIPSNEIKQQIYDLYGDISDYICLHVRRGDYLNGDNVKLYQVLTKEYIERVISKHFPNDKIICISDDINWCKENLSSNPNIVFANKFINLMIDFFIQTLTKGNIISGSTFSTTGVLLNPNPNKICIAPEQMFKHKYWNNELNICPDYAIMEHL